MPAEVRPHTLIRISGVEALCCNEAVPGWVDNALCRAPWVVARRARAVAGSIPVGVRGIGRAARFAAAIEARDARGLVTPQAIAAGRLWRHAARAAAVPAIAALDAVEKIMRAHGFGRWGPAGSVGFELVSGQPAANALSDLDLVVLAQTPPAAEDARSLLAALGLVGARVDVLIELPHGAVALADCAGLQSKWVLRTRDGPAMIAAFTG